MGTLRLDELLHGLEVQSLIGDPETAITGVTYDSRRVEPGNAFFSVRGFVQDGHKFIPEALARGASALVVEGSAGLEAALGATRPEEAARQGSLPVGSRAVPGPAVAVVPSVRRAMGLAAANFFGHPSRKLRVIGVTGTNGKTTTTHLVRELLAQQGVSCGLIGTVHAVVGGESLPASRTTPEAFDLQDLAARMVEAGDRYLSMEVGSHALVLGRVSGFEFDIGVFTNLTQDHLDFHGDMEGYFRAKALLFEELGRSYLGKPKGGPKAAVLNAEDPYAERLARAAAVPVVTYGIDAPGGAGAGGAVDGERPRHGWASPPGLLASNVRLEPSRATFTLSVQDGLGAGLVGRPGFQRPVVLSMTGRHNVANALAALAVLLVEGFPAEAAVAGLASVRGAAGRFETIDAGQPFMAVVDYAHTPDGLENVLQAARALNPRRIITVFGCGGDRDRTKRPLMGEVVARLSDLCVVTSDNPRSEEPNAIIEEIRPGLERNGRREGSDYLVEPDRAKAIALAVGEAGPGDLVLVAGKGHETYQIFAGGRTVHFDDREVLRGAILRGRSGAAGAASPPPGGGSGGGTHGL